MSLSDGKVNSAAMEVCKHVDRRLQRKTEVEMKTAEKREENTGILTSPCHEATIEGIRG